VAFSYNNTDGLLPSGVMRRVYPGEDAGVYATISMIYWSQFASKNYALSVQGFSIIILQRSHSDSLQFNWKDFQSFVKQPMDFQSIVVEFAPLISGLFLMAPTKVARNLGGCNFGISG